jgi:hypothetical protein
MMSTFLPRFQLFEFNERPETPAPLRDMIVEGCSLTMRWGQVLRGALPAFRSFLAESGASEVLDLCAGAGGPAQLLIEELQKAGHPPPRFVLTDLFPQTELWEQARAAHPGVLDFVPEPVDATRIPSRIADGAARTVINAFHHFPPDAAQAILSDAVASSRGIFISEPLERNPLRLASFLTSGLPALFATPLLSHKDRILKTVLTWATPVTLAASTWDGLVSVMRMYSKEELFAMVEPLGDTFRWEYGTYEFPALGLGYYFFGVPRRAPVMANRPPSDSVT